MTPFSLFILPHFAMFPNSPTSRVWVLAEASIGRRARPLDGISIGQAQHFAHGIVDEDEADEGTEAFLSEAGKVAYQHAGLRGH